MQSVNEIVDASHNKLQFAHYCTINGRFTTRMAKLPFGVKSTNAVAPPPKFFLNKHPIHLKRILQQNEINRPLYTIVEQGIK